MKERPFKLADIVPSGCLCGHFESCSVCSRGDYRRKLEQQIIQWITYLETQNQKYREALEIIKPEQLEWLAKWLNLKFPNDANPEVQRDLLIQAAKAREALKEDE